MFTEGLDESAIKWIKQGSEVEAENQQPRVRSSLAERTAPKSPLLFNGNGSFTNSNSLPPLKFHSGFLAVPHSLAAPTMDNEEEDDDESTASVSDSTYSYEGALGSSDLKPTIGKCYDGDEELFRCKVSTNLKRSNASSLNQGFLKEGLRIEVPDNLRRYTDGELGFRESASTTVHKSSTPCGGGNLLQKRIYLRNLHGAMNNERNMLRDSAGLGTPSAPPIFDVPSDGRSNEAADQHQGAPEVFAENDQSGNGTFPSRESEGFDAMKEGLGNWKSHSLRTAEFGERVNKTVTGERETQIPHLQAN